MQKILKNGNTEPLIDRVRKMVGVFEKDFSVSKDMLEQYIGCSSEAFSENDFIRLRSVYKSLKDGMSKREDYFDISSPKKDTEKAHTKLDDKFKKANKTNSDNIPNEEFEGTPFEEKGDE